MPNPPYTMPDLLSFGYIAGPADPGTVLGIGASNLPIWSTALNQVTGIDLTAPGWVNSPDTWVYVSSTSFKVTGKDITKRFSVGTKLSCTDAATTKYFYVVSATFSTDTTVTITGGSDYALSGGVITNPCYSYVATPYGFPGLFAYTPGYSGWAATPTMTCAFSVQGRLMTVWIWVYGTSNGTVAQINLPIAVSATFPACSGGAMLIPCRVGDNSAWVATPGSAQVTAGSATASFYKDMALTGFTASAVKVVGATLVVPL